MSTMKIKKGDMVKVIAGKDKDKEDEEREISRFHSDLQIEIMAVGCGLDTGHREDGIHSRKCAFTNADTKRAYLLQHMDHTLPYTKSVRGGAIAEARDTANDGRIDLKRRKRADHGNGENSRRKKISAGNTKEDHHRKCKTDPSAA